MLLSLENVTHEIFFSKLKSITCSLVHMIQFPCWCTLLSLTLFFGFASNITWLVLWNSRRNIYYVRMYQHTIKVHIYLLNLYSVLLLILYNKFILCVDNWYKILLYKTSWYSNILRPGAANIIPCLIITYRVIIQYIVPHSTIV